MGVCVSLPSSGSKGEEWEEAEEELDLVFSAVGQEEYAEVQNPWIGEWVEYPSAEEGRIGRNALTFSPLVYPLPESILWRPW